MVAWGFVGLVVAAMAYVRFAPLDVARWHVPVEQQQDADFSGGAVRVLPRDAAMLRQIDDVMRGLARTRVLAGSVAAGRITYVTRSAVFGFPDLTTVELRDGQIRMHARLRFGASDMAVNRTRLERVIARLQ